MKKTFALFLCLLGTQSLYAQETLQSVYDRGSSITSANIPNITFIKSIGLNWHVGNGIGSSDNSFRIGNSTTAGTILKLDATGLATFSYNVTAPLFTGDLSGNALTATNWGGKTANWDLNATNISFMAARGTDGIWKNADVNGVKTWLGLGSSAYLTSTSDNIPNTIAARDGLGDINVRLLRSEFLSDLGTYGNYFLTQNAVGPGSDNYARPMSMAAAKIAMGLGNRSLDATVLSTGYSVAGLRVGLVGANTEYLMDASGIKDYLSIPLAGESFQTVLARGKFYMGDGAPLLNGFYANMTLMSEGYKGLRLGYNSANGNGVIMPIEGQGLGFDIATYSGSVISTKLTVLNNGDVGIGTTTPTEKLAVNGKILAKEIKVQAIGWPDYVFEESYQLPSLEYIEKYIKREKHLPEIPSAKEVEKNGIELGEMNKLLLKKIEELTLLMIDLKKDNNKQQEDISKLKAKLDLK